MIVNTPLDFLLLQTDEDAVKIAALIKEIDDALHMNLINQQEFTDLMVDVERARTVIALKNNVKLNQLVHDAIAALIELVKIAKP